MVKNRFYPAFKWSTKIPYFFPKEEDRYEAFIDDVTKAYIKGW